MLAKEHLTSDSIFGSHDTLKQSNLTPMERDRIYTDLLTEEPPKMYHNGI